MSLIKNSKGFSLTSVMIAIGLTGALATIIMNLSKQQASIQHKAVVDQDLNEAISLFRSMIIKRDTCNATLQGLRIGDELDEVRFDYDESKEPFAEVSTDPDYNKAEKFRGTKVVLRKMQILETDPYSDYVIALDVWFEKPSKTLGGKQLKKRFEIAVNRGYGEIVSSDFDALDVVNQCEDIKKGEITSFSTGEKAPDGSEASYIENEDGLYFGYCNIPPKQNGYNIIVACTATE